MAVINPTVKVTKKNTREVSWGPGATADTYTPYILRGAVPVYAAVQVDAGTLTITGSLKSGGTQHLLKDEQGVDISLADGEMSEIRDRPVSIVPIPVGTVSEVTLLLQY
jgi:hypothetical protein